MIDDHSKGRARKSDDVVLPETDDHAGLERGQKWIGHHTPNRNGGGMERMEWSVGGDNGMCGRNGIRRR